MDAGGRATPGAVAEGEGKSDTEKSQAALTPSLSRRERGNRFAEAGHTKLLSGLNHRIPLPVRAESMACYAYLL